MIFKVKHFSKLERWDILAHSKVKKTETISELTIDSLQKQRKCVGDCSTDVQEQKLIFLWESLLCRVYDNSACMCFICYSEQLLLPKNKDPAWIQLIRQLCLPVDESSSITSIKRGVTSPMWWPEPSTYTHCLSRPIEGQVGNWPGYCWWG